MITACIMSFIAGALIMLCAIGVVSNCKEEEPRNKVKFFIARDKNGILWLYLGKPVRCGEYFYSNNHGCVAANRASIENLGLKVDDYKGLKWEDEPVEVFLNLED